VRAELSIKGIRGTMEETKTHTGLYSQQGRKRKRKNSYPV
jgi:hypothetical protein